MCCGTHVELKDDLFESVFFFPPLNLRIKLRSTGLLASTLSLLPALKDTERHTPFLLSCVLSGG